LKKMREQIEAVLVNLVGLPLQSTDRAANMQVFKFGNLHIVTDGRRSGTIGDYSLHIQCAWNIAGPDGVVVGSRNRHYPAGDLYQERPDLDLSVLGANRCDEQIAQLFQAHVDASPIVESVDANEIGDLCIRLSGNFILQVFPDSSLGAEYWRLLDTHDGGSHFVMTSHYFSEE